MIMAHGKSSGTVATTQHSSNHAPSHPHAHNGTHLTFPCLVIMTKYLLITGAFLQLLQPVSSQWSVCQTRQL